MKLHWHRWRTRHGLSYILQVEPWAGSETHRLLGTEIAFVYRSDKRWRYTVNQTGTMPGTWGVTGSPARSRRLVEEYINRKSLAAFADDVVEIHGA